jgi:hypothetical protein
LVGFETAARRSFSSIGAPRATFRPVALRRLIGLCGVLAWSSSARAGDTTPVRIAIEVPEGCSSVRSFYDAVRARTDRIHLTTRPREGLELRVSVVRLQARYRGELRVVDLDGARTTRSVEGASCEEVVRALSLTAALVVDQLVAPVTETAASPGRTEPSTASPPSPSATVPAGPQPAPAQVSASKRQPKPKLAPKPKPRSRPKPEDERDEPRDEEDERDGERDEDRNDDDGYAYLVDSPSHRYPLEIDAGAQALVGELISPRVSVGGAVFASFTQPIAPPFSPSLGFAIAHVPAEFAQGGGDLSIRWTAGLLTACPVRLQLGAGVAIQPCAVGMGGWVEARGKTSDNPVSASRSWWSAGGLGRLSAGIGGSVALRLELGLSVPLVRRRFITTPPDETVGESPEVSLFGTLGVAHVF